MIVAIDGYSSCGKSTLAKELAKELNFTYIDSGAMYRAVAWFGVRQGLRNGEEKNVIPLLGDIKIHFNKKTDDNQAIFLNGVDCSEAIRSMEVANVVSHYAKIKEVREFLVAQQRSFSIGNSIVMDGRDIGTVVFPDADFKIFMTASPEIRAKRRYDELSVKGKNVTMEEVLQNLKERDFIDENREESPLKKAADAFVIDNSNLTREAQLALAISKIKEIQKNNIDV